MSQPAPPASSSVDSTSVARVISPSVSIVQTDARVATVVYDRGGSGNALSSEAMLEITEAAVVLRREHELSAIVLAGTPKVFSLGFDLNEAKGRLEAPPDIAERRRLSRIGRDMCRAWVEIEALTIAAVDGWCVGGGGALAVALDLRVAGAEAVFYLPEISRGLNLSWGAVPRLASLIGPARAKRMAALAEKVDAPTAEAWGLADRVVPAGSARAAAEAWAREAAALPPVALRMCLAQAEAAGHAFDRAASALDADQYVLSSLTEDHGESVRAFLERREPEYRGR
ncbi:MAG: enoyl-CoA hydratase/isomerase family protein [Pseudomonadota bacterium]